MAKKARKARTASRERRGVKRAPSKRAASKRALKLKRGFAAHLATATVLSSPVGPPQPFSTPPSNSGDTNGTSTTSGLQGTLQKFDDGSVVIQATEQLTATRTDGLNSSLTASCRRVQRDTLTTVHQLNYSYKNRVLSDSSLFTGVTAISQPVPAGFIGLPAKTVIATQFGKNDRQDEGTGAPQMGLVQTNSEVFGASVKISVMAAIFGANWSTNAKRLAAMVDVFFSAKGRMVRVPLVDLGPGENAPSHAEVDLTWASDQFLGTQGEATVEYRILIPS
jgi:hypothetical protein